MKRRALGFGLTAVVCACTHAAAPVVAVAPNAPPPDSATVRRTAMIAPRVATGSYRVSANIQSSSAPRRSARSARPGLILLSNEPAAVQMMGGSGAQFNATVTLPGYTHAPPGRTGQTAAWWPIAGDSVVVQFEAQGAQVQLRGAVQSTRIQGEIWYLSLSSGSSLQLGTFTAAKTGR